MDVFVLVGPTDHKVVCSTAENCTVWIQKGYLKHRDPQHPIEMSFSWKPHRICLILRTPNSCESHGGI